MAYAVINEEGLYEVLGMHKSKHLPPNIVIEYEDHHDLELYDFIVNPSDVGRIGENIIEFYDMDVDSPMYLVGESIELDNFMRWCELAQKEES